MSYRTVANTILFVALFPYLTFVPTPFDTQPWALIIAMLFGASLLLKGFSFPRPLWVLLFVAVYALLIYLAYLVLGASDPLDGARSVAVYLSVFFLALASYKTYKYVEVKLFIIAVVIWLLVGVVQLIYDIRFVSWLVPRFPSRLRLGYRGVPSLAPEPAFYATLCIALLILNEIFYKEQKYGSRLYLAIFLALIFQIVISLSGSGLLFLSLFMAVKVLTLFLGDKSTKWKTTSFLSGVIIAITFLLFAQLPMLQQTRGGHLLREASLDPIGLLQRDISVSHRVLNPVIALYGGIVKTWGLGWGLGRIEQEPLPEWLTSWLGIEKSWGGRIHGGLVQSIYELGIVGMLFFFSPIIWIIVRSIFRNQRMRNVCLLSGIVLLSLVTFWSSPAFPLFGYLLGIHLHYAYNQR